MMEVVYQYTKDANGVPRKWEWDKCDCIGLMFHIVNHYTGRHHLKRASYIPSDLAYDEAVKWLYDSFDDPLVPYLKYLVDDAGLRPHFGDDWNLAILHDTKPIRLDAGGTYPIHIVPGVAINPTGSVHYIMGNRGLASANIYKNEIKDFIGFKLGSDK